MSAAAPTSDVPRAVLFACGQNVIRSPMAAALMRHFFGHKAYVASCGVKAGAGINPFVVEVMNEIGIDLSEHVPQNFDDLHDSNFDLVISLAPEAHHRALEMTRIMAIEAEYWPTGDPSLTQGNREQTLAAYRGVRDTLSRRIEGRFYLSPPPNA
ncbi:Arsenate reductase glutaredoxin-coupled, LMWP family [hydrothermal vent metagenome]|uniref:Arsenate reductase glutaredoxin-coupled, LMWP family n=1 Tax=hydrothermal vent metagenome TaxID=652676 RepID=A0A3B0TMI9_9ZZZZ